MTVKPYTINVSQAVLDDLNERLADTRWPDQVEGADWNYGTNLDYLKELAAYWQNGFDWRAQEAKLNQFKQFRAAIDGFGIHFIHERSKRSDRNATPLLLIHGWPDSFYRMYKIIPMLTDTFDVIVPSLPGTGFSDRPSAPGMNTVRTADLFAKLMTELGYDKFAAAGGDNGSDIALHLSKNYPERLIGLHLTDVSYPQQPPEGVEMDEAGGQYLGKLGGWWFSEGAYNMVQSTKPQSLSYGLNDSPVGLAAWIIEKFRSWGDTHGDIESRFSKDELLTNIMIYWVTQTAGSAARGYYESAHTDAALYPMQRNEVPVGIAHFPVDIIPPRSWIEHDMNLQRFTEMPRGGHFAALEEPELLAGEIRAFFRELQ